MNASSSKLSKLDSTEKALENISFGKNMADKKKIANSSPKKDGEVESAFTEDEIKDLTRPDSVLNSVSLVDNNRQFFFSVVR